MANQKKMKFLLLDVMAVTLVLLVTASLFFNFKNTNKTVAAESNEIQITIDKVTTVSIYAFGPGVELVESTNDHDIYSAEIGTTVRLQAVNETRIFTDWVITDTETDAIVEFDSVNDLTSNIINLDIKNTTNDITVTVNRRNAVAEDYGKYMMDRFVIADENDLIALQNILSIDFEQNIDDITIYYDDFALYYNSPELYDTKAEMKDLQDQLICGYFLIANNFTVFNEKFTGLGTEKNPFQGIMCGKNTTNSRLFITITDEEQEGVSSYGLFKYLGNEAVIRNLIVNTTIGITPTSENATAIYAGGLAGVMDRSTLIDVVVSTNIGIESNVASEIYAGGLTGKLLEGSGIDSISDVVYNGNDSKWSISSSKNGSTISAGFIAGTATDSYIKEVDITVTGQLVDLTNDSVTNEYTNSNIYLGNVFGSYIAKTDEETLDDIMIMGDSGETLRAVTTNGDAMVGGLIGYVDASQNGTLNIERVYFRVLGSASEYSASSIEASNVTNLYTGGIIGYVDGTKVVTVGDFKNRLQTVDLGNSETSKVANYLFEGDYKVITTQNGKSLTTDNGKAISGGIVGKGLINLDGELENRSSLAIASPTSSLLIEAIQSQSTSTNGYINDTEHAAAALIYGSVGNSSISISNIDVYTNNTTIKTVREIGSKAIGDLHIGGFIGYATGSTFSNISLYFNDSALLAESLSYDGQNIYEGNNSAFCGGFAGELLGNTSLDNIKFAGYDTASLEEVGTTSFLESIQNTKPTGNEYGNKNYTGENYLGGIVGRIQHVSLNNCSFIGSTTNKDYITMSGHQSPDSAFCGGIVGLIRTGVDNVPSSIINCSVKNTEITGSATCKENYPNPDIYVGGIIGAVYMHSTNITVEIEGCTLSKSNVYALGNELIASYAGGILGGTTWESSINIGDCYVTDSSIKSNTTFTLDYADETDVPKLQSSAGGIIGGIRGSFADNPKEYANVSNCVVIDTEVEAEVNSNYTNIEAFSSGIIGYTENAENSVDNIVVSNCYSNALVTANHKNESGTENVYAIAYTATIDTEAKSIEVTSKKITYNNFTYQNYTFEVVSSETGTYKIKNSSGSYVRIDWWGNLSTNSNSNRATTFTYNNGHLVYNGKYINFDSSNNIIYASSAFDFTTIISTTEQEITGSQNIESGQTYYLNKNVKNNLGTLGTAVGTGPFNIPTSVKTNPYGNYDYLYGFDGSGQKLYIEIIDDSDSFEVTHSRDKVVSITPKSDGVSALAHIWINAKADGGHDIANGELYAPNHENKEEAASYGWFIFDYVLLYTGDLVEISSDLSNIDTSYTDGSSVYEYNYGDVIGDSNSEHYLENINNSSDKIYNNYIENEVQNNIKEFIYKVYDNMLSLNAKFEITHFGANYKLLFADQDGNLIEDSAFKRLYGNIELKLVQKHSSEGKDLYNLVYKPNENIEEDATFYIRFVGGNNAISAQTSFKFNLIANKLQLVGVTYADYTPPLNYYEDDSLLGDSIPYHLYVGSITKFIPVFTKSNDLEQGTKYISEANIEKCMYSIDNTTHFDIFTNGELTAGTTVNQSGTLTVTHNQTTITVNFMSVKDIPATYSIVGAEYSGLNHATNTTDFYFEHYIRSNYSGVPTSSIITVGSTTYDITSDPAAYQGISVYEISKAKIISGDPITEYSSDAAGYIITVSEDLLAGDSVNNISVDIEYPTVYTITFKLQCETFNDSLDEEQLTKTFKITSGTSFASFFGSGAGSNKQEILDWVESANKFGFVFTGFYLVDDASSINSYGVSFEELTQSNYVVNSSNTFYGRWSYLIEIVEASGTYVKTGFNSAFMQEYTGAGFTRAIQIPINTNQGYVFRVDTDEYYVGKAGVEAYVVTIDGSGNKQMTSVPIETYQNNKDLYYIRPEYITGYLVLMTTVSNSEIIVGEHTSPVTENITTEDGIITFKYIVNHYNNGTDQSYIYKLKNGDSYYQTLCKEFVLDFYKQSTHSDLSLPDNTEIRVYYNAYVNGSTTPSKTIVGTYTTHNDDRVYLTEFKLLDLETNAFSKFETFGQLLGDNTSVTEVYYFTITPPNGYSQKVHNEMANYVVECGYVYKKVNSGNVEYLQGLRSQTELANPNDLSDVVTGQNIYESAKQEKVFHIVPSRETVIVDETDGTYTFTDKTTYNVYDIILTDTQKLPDFNYISLYDDTRQSILESSIMSFNIQELRIKLGYRLGKVDIYGYDKNANEPGWVKVAEVDVTSAIYQEYIVDFSDGNGNYPYYAYKIDNVSTNEIRVSGIDVLSNTNGVLYEGDIDHFIEKEVVGEQYSYSLAEPIVGDSRHDGKTFMLAIQLEHKTDSTIIISDIVGDMFLNVNDIGLDFNHYVNLNDSGGKNTAYINLSSIIEVLNVNSINFNITIPEDYSIHAIQLLEVTNEFKPASGEVRVEYNYEHTHYYIDGICKCGDELEGYVSLVDEFATKLVSDFNTAGGNSTTTIVDFYNTSDENIEDIWIKPHYLYKYKWFFEFIKSEMTMVATANNALTDANYLSTIELLNNMIIGSNPSTMFTRDDYTNAKEILRYFIHALINKTPLDNLTIPSDYSKFMIDYYDATNRARFLNAYELSKVTIDVAAYNNSGLVTGGYTISSGSNAGDYPEINNVYLCDVSILPSNGGMNSLTPQNKILLNKVKTNSYEIVGVENKNTSVQDLDTWSHAIATIYDIDMVELYSKYIGDYLIIDDSELLLSSNSTYPSVYKKIVAGTYEYGFSATIVDELPSTGPSSSNALIVDPNNGDAYSTLSAAISAAEDGDTIYVASGTYSTATTIDKSITLKGANAGVNPVTETRTDETIFTKDITVSADDVIIDGIELTDSGRIKGANTSMENIVIQNVLVSEDSTVLTGYDAPINFHTTTSGVEYTNIVIDQVKYEGATGAAMIMYGSHINGLTITNSYFSANSAGQFNNGIKIDGTDASNVYGIKGNVIIKNNYFENFEQYTIWFEDYAEGNYSIINNTFRNCYLRNPLTDGSNAGVYSATIMFRTYRGATSGMVYVTAQYNNLDYTGTIIRFGANTSRTASTQIVKVNYNKASNQQHDDMLFINNANTYNIDATNNWYDITPTASNFLYATWSPYYTDESQVPTYTED